VVSNNNILEVRNLKKYFNVKGSKLHAVDDVSFELQEGSTLGVVGESGCGKTTLGRVILHLLEKTDGEVMFEGKNISQVNKDQLRELRKKMQIIFQDPFSSLNPRMTVGEAIAEPLRINTKMNKKSVEAKVAGLMETVGLAERLVNAYPHELDGGRRQRIGIARALALNPKFIVCDEPVSALDVSIRAQILNLMQDLQNERHLSYLFITHDLSVVRYFSDQIMVMYLGKKVEFAECEDLFTEPLHPYTQALLSAIPIPDIHNQREREILKGELSSPIDPKPGCRFFPRCKYAMEICSVKDPITRTISEKHAVACHLYNN